MGRLPRLRTLTRGSLLGLFFLLLSIYTALSDVSAASRQQIIALTNNTRANEGMRPYEDALKLADSTKDLLASAALHSIIGEIYEAEGRYQDALKFYERGIKLVETTSHDATNDPAAHSIAESLERLRQNEKGFIDNKGVPESPDLYRGENAELAMLFGKPEEQARQELWLLLLINAGNMYVRQLQIDPMAKGLYEAAFDIAEKYKWHTWQQKIGSNLAWSAIKLHRIDDAQKQLLLVLEPFGDSLPPLELRRTVLAFGVILREQQQYDKAIFRLNQALEMYREAKDTRGAVRSKAQIAWAYFQAGAYRDAERHAQEALDLNKTLQDEETNWLAFIALAKSQESLDEREKALQSYEKYWNTVSRLAGNLATDQGKTSFFEDQETLLEDYARAALAVAEKTQRYSIARDKIEQFRSASLNSLQRFHLNGSEQRPGELSVDTVFPNKSKSGTVCVREQQRITEQSNRAACSSTDTGVAGGRQPFKRPDAAPRVTPPPATFLEYFVLADRIAIFIKGPDGNVSGASVTTREDELEKIVRNFLRASLHSNPSSLELSQKLYALLIAPVENLLPTARDATLVIVPHKSLSLLPFAALQDENTGYLGDRYILTYAASEASWKTVAEQPRPGDHQIAQAWIIGNPTMPAKLRACSREVSLLQLPHAEVEARRIGQLFDDRLGPGSAEVFVENQADRLRVEAWHPGFTVLHFGTHAFACDEDPLSSFLVLADLKQTDVGIADGKITVLTDAARRPVTLTGVEKSDSLETRLQGFLYPGRLDARTIIDRFAMKADLVTLSACQTGRGKLLGQGIIGLGRAFLAGGARSLVVSLWSVEDQATSVLMPVFYEQYLTHGNKGLALQKAMQVTRKEFPEPHSWAAFTLIGMAE